MNVVFLSKISGNNSPSEIKVLLMNFVNEKCILFILNYSIKTWSAVLETMGVCHAKTAVKNIKCQLVLNSFRLENWII